MNALEIVIVALGGNIALLAALAWLGRSLFEHWLSKSVEAFKARLEAESNSAAERLRHELGMVALEHQVRFSKLHERRAEVIAQAYTKLVEAYWALQSFASPLEWAGEPDKSEKYRECMVKCADFYRY